MAMMVDLEQARAACLESIDDFIAEVEGFDAYALLGPSRCHGWTRLDLVVHQIAGWQELLGGLASVVDEEPTVDAASFWTVFADSEHAEDKVLVLIAQRRRTAAYATPAAAVDELRVVGESVKRGVSACADRPMRWLRQNFSAADYLTIWAVENAMHIQDLFPPAPRPSRALKLARATAESLLGEPLPAEWPDVDAVLIATGRVPVPEDAPDLADRLPAFG